MALSDDDRFHQAAKDGNLDMLGKANRKDANSKDEDGMTPTIWAAYYGNLAALRKIIERGGNPDKCDYLGNTALHCAASRGHYNCVSYLINFGCNLWAMDNSHRTAMDLASLNDREDIVKLLDQARAEEKSRNPKSVRKHQENAVAEAETRIKDFEKRQKNIQKEMARQAPNSDRQTATSVKRSGFYHTITSKLNPSAKAPPTLSPIVTSRTGEALLKQPDPNRRGNKKKLTDDTSSLASDMTFRTDSGYGDDDSAAFPLRSGLPGLNMAFLPKMRPLQAADLYGLSTTRRISEADETEQEDGRTDGRGNPRSDSAIDSVGSGGSHYGVRSDWRELDLTEDEDEEEEEDEVVLKMFLTGNGLSKFYPLFQKAEVENMETLLLLTETDLEKIGLELGPRKRLIQAILRYKADTEVEVRGPAEIHDSRL
ncbi:putative Usher syndrome type-1G protein-like protein [Hypsibius exemplaris]|uniref:Usher syndrome type-1G protein-like protein n=1 Tax=Hypsibius exemplaris TaxID=2072580 RepID=A0A9X6NRN7_HYPEX|nr:putative Usher syndrome type-1G protein-like protein [Hypsibius exemplaris]